MTLSEDRRKDIRKMQSRLVETTRAGEYDMAIDTANVLIQTTNVEGVTPVMAEMHDILAAIYLDMKDSSNARRYGILALDSWQKLDSVDMYQLEVAHWFLRYLDLQKEKQRKKDQEVEEEEDDDDEY